jgi:hypothetical protein
MHPFRARLVGTRQAPHGATERCDAAAMSGGRRDVDHDTRVRLGRDAQIGVSQLRYGNITTVDAVLDYLVERSFGSPERLLDARDLLGEPDMPARALLLRAPRRAADPIPPAPPKPFAPPDGANEQLRPR